MDTVGWFREGGILWDGLGKAILFIYNYTNDIAMILFKYQELNS